MTETVSNRYLLGTKLGSGGMGDVFRGTDQLTATPVAVKVLKAELATQDMVQRFVREGEALRQLNHPNIVKLLDAVQENGRYYLIMELVEGGSLDGILRQTPRLPVNDVLNIALDLADALTRAHRLNIIHRDIKPANVLLAKDGMLRLTDFGIARVMGSEMTEAGSVLGTIAYIAPEALQGQPADARSDIWSMGLMLFEMLAGEHPFRSNHAPATLIHAILDAALPDLELLRADAPTALVDLIHRMVQKDPVERIPRMRLIGSELEAILANETNIAAPETQQTQLVVLIERGSRFETPSSMSSEVRRNNLSVQTTPFVGREAELGELVATLRDPSSHLLTIVAQGGMGKTRLALEVGGQFLRPARGDQLFEHGIFFIDLAAVTAAEHILGAVAEAVDYAFQQDGRDAKQQLLNYLHEKNMLLIMDNFEHVIMGRDLVQEVIKTAPSVRILVTSREKLNLSAEALFVLNGMSFPTWELPADALEYAAVKLFMQSAHRVRRNFQLEAGMLASVAHICQMVQGMPLGILLAAAWLEVLTPREIEEEINRSLDFLDSDLHDLPERQRSLRAVFEYSWALLSEEERRLLSRCSRFRGGFTRHAALQITSSTLRPLTTLVNKSLLRRDNVTGRYEVHELLRQYAEDKLVETEMAFDAHSRYYIELLTALTPNLKGYGQLEALNVIDIDFDNIRAAWNWAVNQRNAATIEAAVEGLYLYLTFRNRVMDGEQMFGAARQVWKAEGDAPVLLAGRLLVRFPQRPPLAHYRAGLAIAQQHGAAFEIAFCQRLVGHWLSHTEFNHDEGMALLHASLSHYQALGNEFYAAQVLDDLGWSYNLKLDIERQAVVVQQSLDLRRKIGDKIGTGNSLRNMGGGSGGFFDHTNRSITYWEEAKRIAYDMNDRLNIAWNASLQAANLILKGEYSRAEILLEEGYPHAADVNDPVVKGFILAQKGAIAGLRDEDYLSAIQFIEAGFPPGSPAGLQTVFVVLAMAIAACGLRDFRILQPYLEIASKWAPFDVETFSGPLIMPCRLLQLAQLGDYERAAELLQAYLENSPNYVGLPFPTQWARSWGVLKRLNAELVEKLGQEAYQAALARGNNLPATELRRELRIFLDDILR